MPWAQRNLAAFLISLPGAVYQVDISLPVDGAEFPRIQVCPLHSTSHHTVAFIAQHIVHGTSHHTMLRRTTSHHAIWLRILGPPVKCAVPKRVRNAQVSVADNAKLWSNNVRTRAPKWEGLPPVSQKRGQGTACARWRAPPPQFATPIFHPNVSEDGYVWHPYASHYDGSRHRLADLVYHLAVLFAEVSPPSTP